MRLPFLCATQELQGPAGQEDLALSGRQPDLELYLRPVVGVYHECLLSRGDQFTHAFDLPGIAPAHPFVVVLLTKQQRKDALGDQVPAMDACEAPGDDRTDSQVQRSQSSVFAAGALPVVVPADNKTAAPLERAVVELWVLPAEHVLRTLGYVRPETHSERPVGSHVSGRDVVFDNYDDASLQLFWKRSALGRGHDVGSTDDLDISRLLGWRRVQDLAVVHIRVGRRGGNGRRLPQLARVGDLALERSRGGRRRGAKIDFISARPAAAREVAVEGPNRGHAGGGGLSHADAGTADGLEHASASGDEVLVDAALRNGVQDLARPRRDRHLYAGVHDVLPQDGRGGGEVFVGGVHRGADAHLYRPRAGDLAHWHHVARRGRFRDKRLKLRELDHFVFVVRGIGVCGERDVVLLAPLGGEPLARLRVAREDGGGSKLRDHVADRAPIRHRKSRNTLPRELEDPSHAPAYPVASQELEDYVLRLHPVGQLSAQLDAHDLRALQREAVPRHGDGDVETPSPDGEHPDRAGHGGVRVGADQELARSGETFEVDVVGDPVAGAGVLDAVVGRERLQEAMLVHVLVVDLQDVVINVHHHEGDGDVICSERLELESGHGPSGVLDQDLVHGEIHLLPGDEVAF